MNRRRDIVVVLAPLVVALLVGGWLLWARQEPSRQGGYCSNATIEIAGSVADSVDMGAGAAPPVQRILDRVDQVDVSRFQVDTPREIQDQVDELAATRSKAAFAEIIVDYLKRCGNI
ncbi:hypothetical protein [Aquihabitans sp. McL0605]|uniref:hypothetical protein n=1 Tax=Aquihabitans sp. McL0605 TaxID=3415671 RepID=UPI003CEEFA9D